MAQNMAQHFTFAKLLRFTLPSVGMMVFMSLYVMIDGFFVSNWCGATALAAVNFAYPIPAILGSLGFMLGTGGNAIVASTLGSGNRKLANERFSMLVFAALAGGIASDEALEQAGARAGEHLHVWGPCRAPEYAECIQPLAADIIARLTHGHDLVIVDTPSSWGDAVAGAAQQADRLVIVSDERPGAIPALSRCGSLAVRLGVARTRIVRLMNACDPRRRDESFVARAAVGLECAREVRVLDGGLDLVELLGAGGMAELVASENPAALGAAHGLAALLKELGHLPDAEGARHALAGGGKPRRLFGLGRGEA